MSVVLTPVPPGDPASYILRDHAVTSSDAVSYFRETSRCLGSTTPSNVCELVTYQSVKLTGTELDPMRW